MYYLLSLSSKNKESLVMLPNGKQIYIITRLRSFAKYWTIQIKDINDEIITEEKPLIENVDLFKQYTIMREYGCFSVKNNNSSVNLIDYLGNKINLYWNSYEF